MRVAKETGLSYNAIQTHYFLESILGKIAKSNEKENFVFKGGFLLSNVIGIGQRSTVDMDFLMRKNHFTENRIKDLIIKILVNSENEDNISYKVMKVEEIRKESEYGGYRFTILCKLENIQQIIPLDIATGDPITPHSIDYKYVGIFDNESFSICAYNIETILAEKIETIYVRGVFNSRSKDFYDVFILYKLKHKQVDFKVLRKACLNTFEHRGTLFDIGEIKNVLDRLQEDPAVNSRWENYQKKYSYSKGIPFNDVIANIKQVIENIS